MRISPKLEDKFPLSEDPMFRTSPKLLHRFAIVTVFAITTWTGAAMAQTTNPDAPDREEEGSIRQYLTNHPEQAKELHENPALINDPAWLAKNPKVGTFMEKHPNFREDAARDPQNFVGRSEHVTLQRDHHALNNSDRYLSKHPEMKRELAANPKLIDDPAYLAKHPGLEKELKSHPEIREEAMQHPERFKEAVERNEKYNRNHQPRSTTGTPSTTRTHSTTKTHSTTGVKK